MTDVVEPTEITELDVSKVSAVTAPANGTSFLLIKAAAPVAKARESQSSDHDVEAITGSPVPGATCNARTADGSKCRRPPSAGSARCHHHEGQRLAFESIIKEENMETQALKALRQLHPDLSPERVAQLVEHAAAIKGTVQDALNGTDTPKGGGDLPASRFGALTPATGGVIPAAQATQSPSGLPGMSGPLQGGQSSYAVPAEGAAQLQGGTGQSLAAIVQAMSGRSQELPGKPANPQLVRAAKASILEALGDVDSTARAFKEAEQERGPLAAMSLERAGEAATRAALKAQALAQFGPR